jgi:hypothetical protein
MKKGVVMLTLCALLVATFSPGCIYMKVQRPHDKNFEQTELGTKVGKSHLKSVLWLFAWGDAGTKAAAEDGEITVINHADVEYFTILLGLYGRITTVVYGD